MYYSDHETERFQKRFAPRFPCGQRHCGSRDGVGVGRLQRIGGLIRFGAIRKRGGKLRPIRKRGGKLGLVGFVGLIALIGFVAYSHD